jgi:type IV pilus assembly protein PilM
MELYRKAPSTLGLDIGSSMVKAVKMSRKGDKYTLENFAFEPVAEGAIQSGEVRNPSTLAESARKAVEKCHPIDRDVVVAIPNYSILSDVLTMEITPDKHLREAVLTEAQRVTALDMSNVEIDYAVLEKNQETKKMRVLMVAAKNEIILSYVDFLNEGGLRPTIIDVDIFALANIFSMNYDVNKYQNCILVNIGSENTVAIFLQNGRYHSSREISATGSNFKKELMLVPDMTPEKISHILMGKIDETADPEPIVYALNLAGKEFANALELAVSFFQTSENIEKLDGIFLTGGYAWVPGLMNIVELRVGTEVSVLDPFINIKFDLKAMAGFDPKKIGSFLSVSMGLATRKY